MQQFQDLSFRFPAGRGKEFFEALNDSLPKGWRREHEAEERAGETSFRDSEFYYYTCDKTSNHETAMVAIYKKDAPRYAVTNIVPQELSELTYKQYNAILADFHQEVLLRVQTDVPVSFVLGCADLQIEDLMPPEAFRYLRAFSSGANRSTGTSHPSDQKSWFGFIVALYRSGRVEGLDATTLRRWFEEVVKWHPDHATKLAIEYEQAVALLNYAAQH